MVTGEASIEISMVSRTSLYLMPNSAFRCSDEVRIVFPTVSSAERHLKSLGYKKENNVRWEKKGCPKCGSNAEGRFQFGCWICSL